MLQLFRHALNISNFAVSYQCKNILKMKENNNSLTTLHETSCNDVHVEVSTQQEDRNSTVIVQTEAPVCRVDGLPRIVSHPIIPRFPLPTVLYERVFA
jgi:hypothetical protein